MALIRCKTGPHLRQDDDEALFDERTGFCGVRWPGEPVNCPKDQRRIRAARNLVYFFSLSKESSSKRSDKRSSRNGVKTQSKLSSAPVVVAIGFLQLFLLPLCLECKNVSS